MSSEKLLTLIQGSVKPFDIKLYDENDNVESLTGATDATLRILKFVEDVPANAILDVDTASEVAIDIPNSKLTVTMTTVQADALPVGRYVAQANIKISGNWFPTDAFHVQIKDRFAPTI